MNIKKVANTAGRKAKGSTLFARKSFSLGSYFIFHHCKRPRYRERKIESCYNALIVNAILCCSCVVALRPR